MAIPNRAPIDLYGTAVGATLATSLHARAKAGEKYDVGDWRDPQAEEAWAALEQMTRERGGDIHTILQTDQMTLVGTVLRSQAIDERVREFARAHGHVQVVTLGVGLCNRASRLADLDADWIGVDTEGVIALRRKILPQDPTRLVNGSVTQRHWLSEVEPAGPTVIVAEGLLMYLDRPTVTQLLVRLGDHFASPARLIADLHHSLLVLPKAHIAKLTGADFHFGAKSPAAFAQLAPGWRLAATDDTMAPISENAARISKAFATISRGQMYGVVTLDRAHWS
ncbi:class I SAM-dependent methyltransferase [Gephyromycinifex aptenodytis]|uniref:class I SAM-dependent methyltransferase n=1 Tax=Gephyromycinifex aptenodytis TaxID=2716227 RepID=UPI001447674C|nr:class I SAM-dependent methyltransferase [Gephyromycinifex aptenodytis]